MTKDCVSSQQRNFTLEAYKTQNATSTAIIVQMVFFPYCKRTGWKVHGKISKIFTLFLIFVLLALTVCPVHSKFIKPKPGFFGDYTDEEFKIRLKKFIKSMKLVHHRVREDMPWLPPGYPAPPLLQFSVPYLYNAVPPVPPQPPGPGVVSLVQSQAGPYKT